MQVKQEVAAETEPEVTLALTLIRTLLRSIPRDLRSRKSLTFTGLQVMLYCGRYLFTVLIRTLSWICDLCSTVRQHSEASIGINITIGFRCHWSSEPRRVARFRTLPGRFPETSVLENRTYLIGTLTLTCVLENRAYLTLTLTLTTTPKAY